MWSESHARQYGTYHVSVTNSHNNLSINVPHIVIQTVTERATAHAMFAIQADWPAHEVNYSTNVQM